MPSELAEALRSWNVVPSARRTRPDWSQRRMRVWRSAVVRPWASTGKSPAGSGSSRRMERVAESTPSPGRMRRSRPGRPCNSCQSSRISIHSPAWKPSTSSRPMLSTTRRLPPWISLTALTTVALSRDHLNVAVPSGPAVMDLDPVELVLQPLVARRRRHQAGIGIARDVAGRGREPGAGGSDHGWPAIDLAIGRAAGRRCRYCRAASPARRSAAAWWYRRRRPSRPDRDTANASLRAARHRDRRAAARPSARAG